MDNEWSYKGYAIRSGLKPGSPEFRYFYMVSEKGEKKCRYCIWITSAGLSRFDEEKDFERIVDSRKEEWANWVRAKIDQADFRDRALKFDESGETEIDLSDAVAHVSME